METLPIGPAASAFRLVLHGDMYACCRGGRVDAGSAAEAAGAGGCDAAFAEVRRLGRCQAKASCSSTGKFRSAAACSRCSPAFATPRNTSRSSPPTRRRFWSTRGCSGSARSRDTRRSSCRSSSRRRGREIDVTVEWRDEQGKPQTAKAQDWIRDLKTGKAMTYPWVFAGSRFWTDEETGKQYYQAEGGDFICVSNFGTAALDIPVESSQIERRAGVRGLHRPDPAVGHAGAAGAQAGVEESGEQGRERSRGGEEAGNRRILGRTCATSL